MKNVKLKLRLADGSYVETTPILVPTQSDLDKKQDLLPAGQDNQFLHKNTSTGELEWIDAPIKTINYVEPDAEGNVDLKVVPAAKALVSETTESHTDEFKFRTTGGGASIGTGDAYLRQAYGTSRAWAFDINDANFTRSGTFGNNVIVNMSDIVGKKFVLKSKADVEAVGLTYSGLYQLGVTTTLGADISEFIEISEDGTTVTEHPADGTLAPDAAVNVLFMNMGSIPTAGLSCGVLDSGDYVSKTLQYNAGWFRINSKATVDGITNANKAFFVAILNGAFDVTESPNGVFTLDKFKFLRATQNVGSTYTFTFTSNHWELDGNQVSLADYGIDVIYGVPTEGKTIVIAYDSITVGDIHMPTVGTIKSIGFNAFNKANSAQYIHNFTVDQDGYIVSENDSYVCFIKAKGGLANGYVAYDEARTIARVGYCATPVTTDSRITLNPADTLDPTVSIVNFANDGYLVVALSSKDTLCIHPQWSGYRNTEIQKYEDSSISVPTKDANNTDLPFVAWGNKLPAIGSVREGFDFEVNRYFHKINRIPFSWASLDTLLDANPTWKYNVDFLFDHNYIWHVIDVQTFALSKDIDLALTVDDFGTEEWLEAGENVYTTIAYQPNLVDKLRVDTVTYTDQSDLNKSNDQKAQALLNLGVVPNVDGATEILSTISFAGTKYKIRDNTKSGGKGIRITETEIMSFPYVESKTYDEVVTLRDNGELVPGQLYRITDYVCTTAQAETSAANHVFDILVLALDEAHLSEQAWARHHDGDNYFANSNLDAWQIWYCLDNDTSRFAWADDTNGKGVIYRMIDENRNEAPYDFKNIKFDYYYSLATKVSYGGYTFSTGAGDDASMTGIYNNVIKEYLDASGKLALNNNIIRQKAGGSLEAHNNLFGLNTYNNTINATSASDNVLQEQCHNNIFDMMGDCVNNVLDDSCYNNFMAMTDSNLGHGCHNNEIYAESTSLGNNCNDNLVGYASHGVTYASIGNNCDHNYIGGDCQNIYLGSNCAYVVFKDDANERVNYCKNIYIDSACSYIKLLTLDTVASDSNYLQNVHIHSGVKGTSSEYKGVVIADRALDYTTDVFASGSTEMYV